jgi:hypothetical protein
MLSVEANLLEQHPDHVVAVFFARGQMVDIDGLADDLADRHAGVERRGRILEDHLHLTAVREHIGLFLLSPLKMTLPSYMIFPEVGS